MSVFVGSQCQYDWNDRKGMKYKTKVDVTKEQVHFLKIKSRSGADPVYSLHCVKPNSVMMI